MKNLLVYCLIVFSLFISCQEYNKPPYDEEERQLRALPSNSTKVPIIKDWEKRDPLSYARLKNIKEIVFYKVDSIPPWVMNYKKLQKIRIIESKLKDLPLIWENYQIWNSYI